MAAMYAVASSVWFVAANPRGPWQVATVVPDAIYTIPVNSPVHYVTYVHVYAGDRRRGDGRLHAD